MVVEVAAASTDREKQCPCLVRAELALSEILEDLEAEHELT